ncbi:hypothetical protein OBBRIDRAFT_885745 [Obba rivulosa]|uniref:DUF6534 domain-containing protein n=1 Tax=Obba rivulosa TaxID=1052685 RepID=A0A8E2DN40_9APHY|nr:hypothetical protein OBBRIDRAFT_885745 [Obba rivulosa]
MATSGSEHRMDSTLGALEIALMVELVLYGVTSIQTYAYYSAGERDPHCFKWMIGLLWLLDTLHQLFFCHGLYTYTIIEFGNVLAPLTETWSIIANIPLNATMDAIVRSMFCHRIWKFSGKNWFLVSTIMLSSFVEVGSGIAFTVRNARNAQWAAEHALSAEFYGIVAGSIVADSLIAVSQVMLLRKHHSEFRRTNSALHTLMLYSINTGLLTSLCALMMCVLWVTMPDNLVYVVFYAALPTLLLNALLATLNARQELRELISGNPESITFPLLSTAPSSSLTSAAVRHEPGQQELVDVQVSAEIKIDDLSRIA